ncbi:MAG: TetR/AcrR family transcriptional regulator [Prevotella sp.]|nr:TetR/AcrR family transcriptional regulator [Prevotella sp.]
MQELKETTAYRHALKDKILKAAMRAFTAHGIRAVKMDDIASELGISKRTLYEIYEDKEKLLYQGIVVYHQQKHDHLKQYAESGHQVIDIIMEAYRMKIGEVRTINPVFYTDIIKYPCVEEFIRSNREQSKSVFMAFMRQGVEEGVLRADVNYELMPYMFDAIGQYIVSHQLIDKYSVEELFVNFFLVSLRGICTEEGCRQIDEAMLKV